MFNCEKCGTTVPAGTPAQQLVVRRRSKDYPTRSRDVARGRGRGMRTQTIDQGGEGHEIVRELSICPECADDHGLD